MSSRSRLSSSSHSRPSSLSSTHRREAPRHLQGTPAGATPTRNNINMRPSEPKYIVLSDEDEEPEKHQLPAERRQPPAQRKIAPTDKNQPLVIQLDSDSDSD